MSEAEDNQAVEHDREREIALRGVEVDDYGWPVDEENLDRYLRQFPNE